MTYMTRRRHAPVPRGTLHVYSMASCSVGKPRQRTPELEREEAQESDGEELEMIPPPLKRFCSSIVRGVRKIAVEGNIATGKSTFLRILQESSPSYHMRSEPLTRWLSVGTGGEETASQQFGGNLLDMFYKEPTRWAYTFQAYACLSRLKAQLEPVPGDLKGRPNATVFFERSVYSDKFVFAKNCHDTGLISDLEWSVYCDWHGFLLHALPLKFDAFIYLRTKPQVHTCLERLHKRDRPEERTVSLEYLQSLHQKHEDWLVEKNVVMPPGQKDAPILLLDCDSEFETNAEKAAEHMQKVSDFISNLPREQQP